VTAADVLAEARAVGVELTATADDRLRWRSRGAIPSALRDAIAANKVGLLALLAGSQRPLYALDGKTGQVVSATSSDRLPEGTTHVAREGDSAWTPVRGPCGKDV
jgi:hypothetical protein